MILLANFLKAAEIYLVSKTETDRTSLELFTIQRKGNRFFRQKNGKTPISTHVVTKGGSEEK